MTDVPLSAEQIDVEDVYQAIELYYERRWTDGLPVVPPTEKRVRQFLDAARLDPADVLGEVPERDRVLTAELLAINAVMAGCRPEYMPVLVAATEAVTDPAFKFNHLASLGSPWPVFVLNGPLGPALGFNSGLYLFGPAARANATCARAMSLLLWNCAEARPDGIQRGQWGNPFRAVGFVAEDESTAWDPLHVTLGHPREASTVTAVSAYPALQQLHCARSTPEGLLDTVVDAMSTDEFFRGTYLLFVSPQHAAVFLEHGWSKRHVRDYVWARCRRSVAELKRRGTWGVMADKPDSLRSALTRFAQLVPLSPEEIDQLSNPKFFNRARPTVILSDASFEQISLLKEHQADIPGLVIQAAPKRFYRDSSRVAAFVGYTREITADHLAQERYEGYKQGQQIGASGLEDRYEEVLRGREGTRFAEVDAKGRTVASLQLADHRGVGFDDDAVDLPAQDRIRSIVRLQAQPDGIAHVSGEQLRLRDHVYLRGIQLLDAIECRKCGIGPAG